MCIENHESEIARLSEEVAKLHKEMEWVERLHERELADFELQWTNTLLEAVRPLAADVRDHIRKLREDRPDDAAIRSLGISYYNLHRELAKVMGLNPKTDW